MFREGDSFSRTAGLFGFFDRESFSMTVWCNFAEFDNHGNGMNKTHSANG